MEADVRWDGDYPANISEISLGQSVFNVDAAVPDVTVDVGVSWFVLFGGTTALY